MIQISLVTFICSMQIPPALLTLSQPLLLKQIKLLLSSFNCCIIAFINTILGHALSADFCLILWCNICSENWWISIVKQTKWFDIDHNCIKTHKQSFTLIYCCLMKCFVSKLISLFYKLNFYLFLFSIWVIRNSFFY